LPLAASYQIALQANYKPRKNYLVSHRTYAAGTAAHVRALCEERPPKIWAQSAQLQTKTM